MIARHPSSNIIYSIRRAFGAVAAGIANVFSQPNSKDLIIPILSLFVALAGIVSTSAIQIVSLRAQSEIKQYEVTFLAKQKAYAAFMRSSHDIFNVAIDGGSSTDLKEAIGSLELNAYAIQPFLGANESSLLWDESQRLIELSLESFRSRQAKDHADVARSIDKFLDLRDRLRSHLKKELFDNTMQ